MLKELKNQLTVLHSNWEKHQGLDANWVCVKFKYGKDWRLAKKMGAKKDYYYGWVLWSGSVNSAGTDFMNKVEEMTSEYDFLRVVERQL